MIPNANITVGSTQYRNSVSQSKEYSVMVVSINPCGNIEDENQFPFLLLSVSFSTGVQGEEGSSYARHPHDSPSSPE
jgi:radical SAM superfamily enzyme with C-terminal helix-hairpin-helix motif